MPLPAESSISSCSPAENEEVHMTIIKLKKYYPYLSENITLEVSDEIAVTLSIGGCQCDSYKRRKRDHGECSLDTMPGFATDVIRPPLTPEQVMEQTEAHDNLYEALDHLPPAQARRIYARFILGKTVAQIAQAEGVDECCIRKSIRKGLIGLKKYLNYFC